MSLEQARAVADAVLYEGYVLYPYRASAQKNQARWQWGVLTPPAYDEASRSQTECLIEPLPDAKVRLAVRFLQVQRRLASLDAPAWDEAVEHEIVLEHPLAALLEAPAALAIAVPGGRDVEGDTVRVREPVAGELRVTATRLEGPYGVVRLRAEVENLTDWEPHGADRSEAARRSLVATHVLLAVSAGSFVSLLEYPEWATALVAGCENVGTWPVLVGAPGSTDVVLSSPIILYDYPQIAPESAGELYDGTEIDEILTLRTMTLTEDEKREARATDARAAALLDRVDLMPPEYLERLHGAIRSVAAPADAPQAPWWDPGVDASVSPDSDTLWVGAVQVAKGSRVRLRPGQRRTDAQDMFLAGRIAQVEAVFLDVDQNSYLAVTLADDPGADLQRAQGRFLYFQPDEVEPA